MLDGALTELFLRPLHHPGALEDKREFVLCCFFTDLDDLLHARGADHVGVGVEADLVDNRAVTLKDHKRSVHHATWASLKRRRLLA